ncbi:MAG TPA: VWA domain-containing protein [Capsulimonadaceae bacterium]|jgi:hypothetical protein
MTTQKRWEVALAMSLIFHIILGVAYYRYSHNIVIHPKKAYSAILMLTPPSAENKQVAKNVLPDVKPTVPREIPKSGTPVGHDDRGGGSKSGGSKGTQIAKATSVPDERLPQVAAAMADTPSEAMPNATPDVNVVASETPQPSHQATVPSLQMAATPESLAETEADEVPSAASASGNGTKVASYSSGPSGSGLDASGTGLGTGHGAGVGNGVGNGSGEGTGNGNGIGNGNGNGSGLGNGRGNRGGHYTTGDRGLPYGLHNGDGNDNPKRTVYLLDVSPSMSTKISSAVKEVYSVINKLVHQDMFDIVLFGDTVNVWQPNLTGINPESLANAEQFLGTPVEKKGGTNLESALTSALQIADTREIVVVTDGMPTHGETGPHNLASIIAKRNYHHTRIFTVGLMDSKDDSAEDINEATALLQLLAQQNGGATRILDVAKW